MEDRELRPEEISRHHEQRIKRGWSIYDWYSGDVFIAKVIGEMAAEYRGKGYPADLTSEEWDTILTRISDSLLDYAENKFKVVNLQNEGDLTNKAQEALRLFADHFPAFWD